MTKPIEALDEAATNAGITKRQVERLRALARRDRGLALEALRDTAANGISEATRAAAQAVLLARTKERSR